MLKRDLEEICKKHPSWKKVFFLYYEKEGDLNLEHIKDIMLKISTYKKLLNTLGINIDYALSIIEKVDHRGLLEILDDDISSALLEHKINHFISSLKTRGYCHLFNEQVNIEIKNILHSGISIDAFNRDFVKKIAYFKNDINSENFLNHLKNFKEKNTNWNKDFYLSQLNSSNLIEKVDILYENNTSLMILIKDYYSCKILGPESWCIVQRESIFNNYTKDLKRQMIYLDFSRPVEDPKSLIGFTVDVNGDIHYSYLRNDYATPDFIKDRFSFEKLDNDFLYNCLLRLDEYKRNELIFSYGLFEMSKRFISRKQDCTEFLLFSIKKERYKFVDNFIEHFQDNFCPHRLLSEFFPKIGSSHMNELSELDSHANSLDSLFSSMKTQNIYPTNATIQYNQIDKTKSITESIISGIIAWIDLLCKSDFIVNNIPSIEWIKDENRFPYKEVQDRIIEFYSND